MNILTKISALGLLAAVSVSGSCGSSGSDGLGGDTKASIGLFLESVSWGRLVDVRDIDGVLVESNVMINHLIESDNVNFQLVVNPVSQKETLNILRVGGSASFESLLNTVKSNLIAVVDKAVDSAPPFTEIARNASIRMEFSDLLDPSSVDFTTIQVFTGNPPLQAFTGRYIVKNDTDLGRGYVYFDTTVSAAEAASESVPQNSVGLPSSSDSLNSNLVIKIPTEPDSLNGQPKVLRSLTGGRRPSVKNRLTEPFENNGSDDVLVRAARTGNSHDDFGGFLLDNSRPNLLGVQAGTINSISLISGSTVEFLYTLSAVNCKPMAPKVGDVFEVGTGLLVVIDVLNAADAANYSVRAVIEAEEVTLVSGATALPIRYTTRYTPQDALVQACYLEIQPPPGVLPVGDMDAHSTVTVRFDEPVDGRTVRSMSTFVIASPDNVANPAGIGAKAVEAAWFRQVEAGETVGEFIDRQRTYDYRAILGGADAASEFGGRILFGFIEVTDGSREFTLAPLSGLIDQDPTDGSTHYVVALRGGVDGIHDLSGNSLDLEGFVAGNGFAGQVGEQDVKMTVAGGSAGDDSNARYFRLGGISLDEDGDGQAEWSGNVHLADNALTGRFPSRFSRAADSSSAAMSNRQIGPAVNEPLNPAGAVLMSAYRVQEFGFGYPDPTEYDMSIEGFNWSPNAGVVLDETFDDMSLSLGTSIFLPDEILDITGQPVFPSSGLVSSAFDDNILGFTPDGSSGVDEVEVFRSSYTSKSIDLFVANGAPYMPWPDFTTNYVWRDTTIPQTYLGTSAESAGAPNQQYAADVGLPFGWAPTQAPSVVLPLLARFRTYPQSERLGLNSLSTTKMMPNMLVRFRLWSAGGLDGSGVWHLIQPDNPLAGGTIPTGGYQPGGQPTDNQADDLIVWARADFVMDVSRIYSHWFDMGTILLNDDIRGVVVEPAEADQPDGTFLEVEFRGSASVSHFGSPGTNPSPLTAADTPFDSYGDLIPGVGSVSTPSLWTSEISDLEGQGFRYFQVRVTFHSNADLGLRPELDGLGIVWDN